MKRHYSPGGGDPGGGPPPIQTVKICPNMFTGTPPVYTGPPIPSNAAVCVSNGAVGTFVGVAFHHAVCVPPTVGFSGCTFDVTPIVSTECGCDC